jgi:hypothetical protein
MFLAIRNIDTYQHKRSASSCFCHRNYHSLVVLYDNCILSFSSVDQGECCISSSYINGATTYSI